MAAMHYTGMAAMRMQAHLSYDLVIVAISLGIAVVASIAALWLVFNATHLWQVVASALVMGLAVCGMHYTGCFGDLAPYSDGVRFLRRLLDALSWQRGAVGRICRLAD
jgi:NO-binding membrane sensor protein with MHYT domain